MKRAPLLALVLLAACGDQPAGQQPDQRVMAPLPKAVCDKARAALAQLKGRVGMEITGPAQAIVEQDIWLNLGIGGRDQLAQLLAFDAACAAPAAPPEQEVTVQNQFGTVLMRRVVETGVDMSQFLE